MPSPPFLRRGAVVVISFPSDDPARSEFIDKYALCLQEGKILVNRPTFTAVLLTTCKDNNPPRIYAWNVYVSPAESRTQFGCVIDCGQIHTIPKADIKSYAYFLESATMEKVNTALQFGTGILRVEDLKKK